MDLGKMARRFLIPAPIMTLICLIRFGAKVSPKAEVELSKHLKLGKNTNIGSFVKIKASGPMVIGRDVSVGTGCTFMASEGGIIIGDDTMIASNVVIISSNFNYDDLETPIRLQGEKSIGVTIGNNCWIGAGVIISDGAVIEDGVIIASMSLVSGKIKKNSIIQGNPAKAIFVRR